jgi:hypothetical protein
MRTVALLAVSVFLGCSGPSGPYSAGAFDETAHRPEVVFNVRELGAAGDGKMCFRGPERSSVPKKSLEKGYLRSMICERRNEYSPRTPMHFS